MEQFMKAFSEDNDRPYQFESVISQTEMQSPDKTASDYLEIGKHALKYGKFNRANFKLKLLFVVVAVCPPYVS